MASPLLPSAITLEAFQAMEARLRHMENIFGITPEIRAQIVMEARTASTSAGAAAVPFRVTTPPAGASAAAAPARPRAPPPTQSAPDRTLPKNSVGVFSVNLTSAEHDDIVNWLRVDYRPLNFVKETNTKTRVHYGLSLIVLTYGALLPATDARAVSERIKADLAEAIADRISAGDLVAILIDEGGHRSRDPAKPNLKRFIQSLDLDAISIQTASRVPQAFLANPDVIIPRDVAAYEIWVENPRGGVSDISATTESATAAITMFANATGVRLAAVYDPNYVSAASAPRARSRAR